MSIDTIKAKIEAYKVELEAKVKAGELTVIEAFHSLEAKLKDFIVEAVDTGETDIKNDITNITTPATPAPSAAPTTPAA
jgi:hypothetical protein